MKDEYVVYTAHWDHLGKDPVNGDQTYNGAATSVAAAALLEIAQAYTKIDAAEAVDSLPRRSPPRKGAARREVLCEHPLYPLNKTAPTSTWTASISGDDQATSP